MIEKEYWEDAVDSLKRMEKAELSKRTRNLSFLPINFSKDKIIALSRISSMVYASEEFRERVTESECCMKKEGYQLGFVRGINYILGEMWPDKKDILHQYEDIVKKAIQHEISKEKENG